MLAVLLSVLYNNSEHVFTPTLLKLWVFKRTFVTTNDTHSIYSKKSVSGRNDQAISKKVVNFILRMNMKNQTAGQREMRLSSSALQRLFALIFCQTTEWITLYKFVKLLLQRCYEKNTYNIEKKTTAPKQIRTKINARMQLF